jgi:hypothetical protein
MTSLVRHFPILSRLQSNRAGQASAAPAAAVPRAAAAIEELRGAAMRQMFPKLYSWCASRWEWAIAMEVHAYLAGATSVADLEQRIRNVERRRHFRA